RFEGNPGCLEWCERCLTCGSPHPSVGSLLQRSATATSEYPTACLHPVGVDVLAKDAHEYWRNGHATNLIRRTVLETALVTGTAFVRPTLFCTRFRGRQIQPPPARLRQNAVMPSQGDPLGWPEPSKVENGEVGVQMRAAVALRPDCRKKLLHLRRTSD